MTISSQIYSEVKSSNVIPRMKLKNTTVFRKKFTAKQIMACKRRQIYLPLISFEKEKRRMDFLQK